MPRPLLVEELPATSSATAPAPRRGCVQERLRAFRYPSCVFFCFRLLFIVLMFLARLFKQLRVFFMDCVAGHGLSLFVAAAVTEQRRGANKKKTLPHSTCAHVGRCVRVPMCVCWSFTGTCSETQPVDNAAFKRVLRQQSFFVAFLGSLRCLLWPSELFRFLSSLARFLFAGPFLWRGWLSS